MWPENLAINSVFHLPEILDHILTYSLTINNVISLCLVSKSWNQRIKFILRLSLTQQVKSQTNLISSLILKHKPIVLPLIRSYIKDSPDVSICSLLEWADSVENAAVSAYIRRNHVYSFTSLIGWTILGYIKGAQIHTCESLKDIAYPFVPKGMYGWRSHEVGLAINVCKPNSYSYSSLHSTVPRTILITNTFVPKTYRILESYIHPIDKDKFYIPLNEIIQKVYKFDKYNKDWSQNKDTIELLFSHTIDQRLEICTESKFFHLKTADTECTYLSLEVRENKIPDRGSRK